MAEEASAAAEVVMAVDHRQECTAAEVLMAVEAVMAKKAVTAAELFMAAVKMAGGKVGPLADMAEVHMLAVHMPVDMLKNSTVGEAKVAPAAVVAPVPRHPPPQTYRRHHRRGCDSKLMIAAPRQPARSYPTILRRGLAS